MQVVQPRDFHLPCGYSRVFILLTERPRDIREVRDEERLVTLLVWRHEQRSLFLGTHPFQRPSCSGPKFFRETHWPNSEVYPKTQEFTLVYPKARTLSMSPSGEDISILALGRGVKVVSIVDRMQVLWRVQMQIRNRT